jgi:hypothetical protein
MPGLVANAPREIAQQLSHEEEIRRPLYELVFNTVHPGAAA